MKIEMIDGKKLVKDPMNCRHTGANLYDESLADSIEAQGIIEPMIVRTRGNKFGIVAGGKRWTNGKVVGLTKFPCIVRDDLKDDFSAFGFSLQENMARKNLSSLETADAVKKLWDMANGGKSYKEKIEIIQKRVGLKERQIANYVKVANLPEKVKELIKPKEQRKITAVTAVDGMLDVDKAYQIETKLEDRTDKDKLEAAKIVVGKTQQEARRVLNIMEKYPEKSPNEIYEEKIKKAPKGELVYQLKLRGMEARAFHEATIKTGIVHSNLIHKIVLDWLKKEGYL